jgi:hypothetical protein
MAQTASLMRPDGGTPAEWDELVEVIEEAAHEVLTLPVPPNWLPH